MLFAVEQALTRKHRCRSRFHRQRRGAEPPQIMVVKDNDLAITRQADVAFDARAQIKRGAEGGQAVFRNARSVEPAMREPFRPGV